MTPKPAGNARRFAGPLVLNRAGNVQAHPEQRVPDHVQGPQVAVAERQVARIYRRLNFTQEFALRRVHLHAARRDVQVPFHVRANAVGTGGQVRNDQPLVRRASLPIQIIATDILFVGVGDVQEFFRPATA